MFSQIADLLIRTAFGFFVYALLLRFYMQWLRAPFRNPVGQFVTALTDWAVRPVRRLIPGLFGVDLASILIAWFIEALLLVLLYWLKGFSFAGAPGIAAGLVFTIAAMELLRASLRSPALSTLSSGASSRRSATWTSRRCSCCSLRRSF